MKIGIDISQIVYEGTGVANYTKNLVENLLKIDKKNKYLLFGGSLRRQATLRQFTNHVFPFPPTFLDFVWNRLHTLPVENLIGPVNIFHSSDWTQPPTRAKKVTTIHDLVVYIVPETSRPTIVATHKRRLNWVKKEVDLIITDSEATKNDCFEILGIEKERMKVIPLSCKAEFTAFGASSREFKQGEVERVRKVHKIPGAYVLAVGVREPRKNLDRLIQAFEALSPKGTRLVIVGKHGWGKEEVPENKNVRYLGFVPQEDVPPLYAGASVFVYPSLYEGFGMPVLEAMNCGCPVITSNISSLPEVGGEVALYVNPKDVDDIAEKIKYVLDLKSDQRQKLVEQGFSQAKKFSWEKTARETLKVYEELA